jgi:hypothetical protein
MYILIFIYRYTFTHIHTHSLSYINIFKTHIHPQKTTQSPPGGVEPGALATAVSLLKGAHKPLLVVGKGAAYGRAEGEGGVWVCVYQYICVYVHIFMYKYLLYLYIYTPTYIYKNNQTQPNTILYYIYIYTNKHTQKQPTKHQTYNRGAAVASVGGGHPLPRHAHGQG